jgi:chloramphenicol-sensitive protein RarD
MIKSPPGQVNSKYYIAAISAFTTWGFFSLVLKPLHAYPSLDILFYRVFLCAVLMSLIVLLFKRKTLLENIAVFKALPIKEKRKSVLLNLGGGVFLTVNWFSYIYVLNHISIKATSLAYLICPILTTILAYFILKEKLNKIQWLAIALSIMGCGVLSYANPMDMMFSVVIGLSYAFYLVSQRLNYAFDKFLVLSFHIIFSALLLAPFYPIYSAAIPGEASFYIYIGLIAVAFTILPLFLNLYALKGINSSTVGMLLNINPLIAFLLAIIVFKEQIDLMQVVAYLIIFISVIVFNAHLFFPKHKGHP